MMETREAMAMSLVVALPDQRQARRSARQELGATASHELRNEIVEELISDRVTLVC
jgi:hypothetical protein